jgi:hypothetical protein
VADLSSTSHPNWQLALDVLRGVLPFATGFDPDDLNAINPADWVSCPTEDRADDEIWAQIAGQVTAQLRGLVVAVTFASYLTHVGPFFVQASALDGLIRDHADVLDDCFFSGDATIVVPTSGTVIAVHHDGLLAVLKGNSLPGFEAADLCSK